MIERLDPAAYRMVHDTLRAGGGELELARRLRGEPGRPRPGSRQEVADVLLRALLRRPAGQITVDDLVAALDDPPVGRSAVTEPGGPTGPGDEPEPPAVEPGGQGGGPGSRA